MSLENGILGYLSIKPLSGYDLKKLFNMSAAYFWPADQAQIYRSLKKLVADGSIELTEYSHGETVNKKIYAITAKGRETLRDWLLVPKRSDFITHAPYLMQLFLSGALSRDEQITFIDRQLKEIGGLIQRLRDNYIENKSAFAVTTGLSKDDRRFEAAVYAHRWGILSYQTYANLLESIKADILAEKDDQRE